MALRPLTLTLSPLGRGDDKGGHTERLLSYRLGDTLNIELSGALFVPSPQGGEGQGEGAQSHQLYRGLG